MVREIYLGRRAAVGYGDEVNSRAMTIHLQKATLALFLASAACFGQNQAIVLKAARMFDGHRMSTPGLVVVSGTTILGVGADAPIPTGARVIAFGDAPLSPGLMDAHTHLSFPNTDDMRQMILDGLQKTVAEQTLAATPVLKKTLMAGITTARDVGSSDFMD